MKMAVMETKASDGSVKIQGYASTPDVDRHDEIVDQSAMKQALKGFMTNPVLLLQHDSDKPIGNVDKAVASDLGLMIEATIKHDTDGVMEKVQAGTLKGFSVGFIAKSTVFRHKKDGTEIEPKEYYRLNYDEMTEYRRVIKSLELLEISVVSIPSNPKTLFTLAKSLKSIAQEERKGLEEDEQPSEEALALDQEEVTAEQEEGDGEAEEEATEEGEEVSEEAEAEEEVMEEGEETQEQDQPSNEEEVNEEAEAVGETPTDETSEGKSIMADNSIELKAMEDRIEELSMHKSVLVEYVKELEAKIAKLEAQPVHKGITSGQAVHQEVKKSAMTRFLEDTIK